jgi:tartrate-resistant acid phosphatase type 5
VADGIKSVCDRDGCEFALYLGDNFYESGVDDVDDSQWDEKFELPYAEFDFPFYPVLGNHDYGGEGIGWELWKGSIYVDYSAYSDKWTMPDLYHSFTYDDATFYALDTTEVFWGLGADQLEWLQDETAASASTWKLAFGHHPYISNGPHGNAGEYEGLDWIPIVNGEAIQDFVEDGICGAIDVYLCGHDHSLQWPEGACGTEFIVSGAGAKTTELEGDNATWFESDQPDHIEDTIERPLSDDAGAGVQVSGGVEPGFLRFESRQGSRDSLYVTTPRSSPATQPPRRPPARPRRHAPSVASPRARAPLPGDTATRP